MTELNRRNAVYPGSFDPPTNGHLDIIERMSRLVDHLIIGIGNNSRKQGFFTVPERIGLLTKCCSHLSNVTIASFDGLAVEFAAIHNAKIIVRGIRSGADLGTELPMAHTNRALHPEVEVVFIPTALDKSHISSSLVREIVNSNGDASQFVPDQVAHALKGKIKY